MHRLLLLFTFVLIANSVTFAAEQDSLRVAGIDTVFHPQIKPSLAVTRKSGEITIDGDLSDPGWQNAAQAGNFTCALPLPGTKPQVNTTALITYDNDYLYVAFIAEDPHPEEIRASLVTRDNMFDDDFMGIILDTYGDATRAFEIYANPLGIQGDLFWTATNEDATYDLVYKSEAKITDHGWQLEMQIPFKSLRFPDQALQNFHCCFWRNYPRESIYKFGWACMNFYVPCSFCQLGSLTGIENVHPSGSFELLPALVGSQSASRDEDQSHLVNDPVKISPSLGLRYAIGTATSIEAALNPDFSQVEADAPQISANKTFALYYPEHRPFFQDGSDLFNTPISAVYTRSINSPLAAAKTIYRDNATSIAYIGAYDEQTPVIIPLEEKSIVLPDVGKSLSNILRATHSFGDNIAIGGLLTDRRYAGNGSNTIIGLDGRAQIYENIEFVAQGLFSSTKEQKTLQNGYADLFDNGKYSVEFDGEQYSGYTDAISLQRFTPGLDVQLGYAETSPAFRAGNGFIFNNDFRGASGFFGYKFPLAAPPDPFKWVVEVDGSFTTAFNWNYEHQTKLRVFKPELDFSFLGQTDFHVFYRAFTQEFHSVIFQDLYQVDFRGSTHPAQWLNFGGELTVGYNIAQFLDTPLVGKQIDLSCYARLKPVSGLLLEPTYAFSQLDSLGGGHFYSGSVYRMKATYQFNKSLSARLIAQYDGFAQILEIDPLLTYQVNPFTSIFIGSSHDYNSFMDSGVLRPSERHFFAKVQYLLEG